jgi:ClpP class serine protease
MSISDRTKADEARGVKTIEIVSSQSPKKRLSPTSSEGQTGDPGARRQLAGVFIDAVARNRAVSVDTVLADFGEGGVFVGEDAVTAGLADRVGSYEALQGELSAGKYSAPVRADVEARIQITEEEQHMPDNKPAAVTENANRRFARGPFYSGCGRCSSPS